jgi:cell division protein FtsQ
MSVAVAAVQRLRLPSGRPGRWALGLCLLAFALAAGYTWWLRDSSLVAVKTVKVEGVPPKTADGSAIRKALIATGREMTTLHVRAAALEEAVREFPLVRSITVEPSFPSTLTVEVTRRQPAALIGSGSDAVAVAGDGTILRGLPAAELRLPRLPLGEAPKRSRLSGPIRSQALVLGAAPKALRPLLDFSYYTEEGVVVELKSGIELRFGPTAKAAQKWRAAAAVLADPELTALDYVDLSVARRPAVGGSGYALPPAG